MKDAARRLFQQSRAHLDKGEVGRAVHVLKGAIELEPDDASLWQEMYRLCMLAGSPRSALVAAFELRRIDPHSADYAYQHGIASLADGQVREAATILEDALAKAPDSTDVRRALAQAYGVLQRPERVRELLSEAVARAPTDPNTVNDYAVHLLTQGAEGKREAAPLLRRVLAAHPDDTGAHLNLALALSDTEPAVAREHATRATKAADAEVSEQARRLLSVLAGR